MKLPPEVDRLRQATTDYLAVLRAAQAVLPGEPADDPDRDVLFTLRDHIDAMLDNAGGTPEGLRFLLERPQLERLAAWAHEALRSRR